VRPGDAAWSRALDAHLSPPEREECPECGDDVEEDEDGAHCVACEWRVDRPEPDDVEYDERHP
jgi:hypothetical protein